METWHDLAMIIGGGITFVILGMALLVLWKIFRNDIDLEGLIQEDGKASLSRFQFLVFTFVVAGVFLLLSIESGTFVDLPNNVLILLGLSGGSYVVSKGISTSAKKAPPPEDGQ
ncbi:hypothetical protein [Phenylobacterium sp.]|uniref:hypothetical protein n=1 Tax=Phenylobacterium sp. TaxID=1871053 RepID=UPI0025FB1A42|nr:hypothetical protein [Phenylobacterium sp.]